MSTTGHSQWLFAVSAFECNHNPGSCHGDLMMYRPLLSKQVVHKILSKLQEATHGEARAGPSMGC
jgi:hypothetical protein